MLSAFFKKANRFSFLRSMFCDQVSNVSTLYDLVLFKLFSCSQLIIERNKHSKIDTLNFKLVFLKAQK